MVWRLWILKYWQVSQFENTNLALKRFQIIQRQNRGYLNKDLVERATESSWFVFGVAYIKNRRRKGWFVGVKSSAGRNLAQRDSYTLQLALWRISSLLLRNSCCSKGFTSCLLLFAFIVVSILSFSTFLSGIGFCRIPNAKNYVYLGFTGSPQGMLGYRQERYQDTSGSLPTFKWGLLSEASCGHVHIAHYPVKPFGAGPLAPQCPASCYATHVLPKVPGSPLCLSLPAGVPYH